MAISAYPPFAGGAGIAQHQLRHGSAFGLPLKPAIDYMTQDFSILKVNGSKVTDTGKRFKVPGHPASARMGR